MKTLPVSTNLCGSNLAPSYHESQQEDGFSLLGVMVSSSF